MSWKGWLALTLALPLLYLLSVPPLMLTNSSNPFSVWPLYRNEWMAINYHLPYYWLAEHTPLQSSLVTYETWWEWAARS